MLEKAMKEAPNQRYAYYIAVEQNMVKYGFPLTWNKSEMLEKAIKKAPIQKYETDKDGNYIVNTVEVMSFGKRRGSLKSLKKSKRKSRKQNRM
jgi:hypothetical protein